MRTLLVTLLVLLTAIGPLATASPKQAAKQPPQAMLPAVDYARYGRKAPPEPAQSMLPAVNYDRVSKTCHCSERCVCGCNDGQACRCGAPRVVSQGGAFPISAPFSYAPSFSPGFQPAFQPGFAPSFAPEFSGGYAAPSFGGSFCPGGG